MRESNKLATCATQVVIATNAPRIVDLVAGVVVFWTSKGRKRRLYGMQGTLEPRLKVLVIMRVGIESRLACSTSFGTTDNGHLSASANIQSSLELRCSIDNDA